MATHHSILAWELPGQRSLMGYSLWNLKKDGNDLVAKQEQQYTKYKLNCCHYISFFLKVAFTQYPPLYPLMSKKKRKKYFRLATD